MNGIAPAWLRRFVPAAGLLVAATLTPACERQAEEPLPEAPPPAASPSGDPGPTLYPPEVVDGFALAVEKRGSRTYEAYGWTNRTDSVRIEVEDGHNILFGPVVLAVREDHFASGFRIEPTDRDQVFVYVTDVHGNRLAVIPVDTARTLTIAGPPERVTRGSEQPR